MPKTRILDRPKIAGVIIGLTVEGQSSRQIATILREQHKVSVSGQAVRGFLRRHSDEVERLASAARYAEEQHSIAVKVARIAAKQERWEGLKSVIRERAANEVWADIPGWKSGLLVHQRKSLGGGRNVEVIDEFAVDTGLLAALDRLEREAAEEMGDLPKASIAIDNRNLTVFTIQIGDDDSNQE